MKLFWAKLLKRDKLHLRRSDSELIRITKQHKMFERRNRFKKQEQAEQDLIKSGMDTENKKLAYFQ